MEKIRLIIWGMLFFVTASYGQSATKVLDKTASVVSNKNGVEASFTISSKQYGDAKGTISVKGKKFYANTSAGIVWFDGKTQWTYVQQNDEVNICNPTQADLQAINPYNFIYMYKQGYTSTMSANGNSYVCTNDAGSIIGTFFYTCGPDIEPTYREITDGSWLDGSPYGVVHRIASDGSEKGIGMFCLDWAYAQCGHLRIDTHGDNTVMQNLVKKAGFVHCGTIYVAEDNDPRLAYEKSDKTGRNPD